MAAHVWVRIGTLGRSRLGDHRTVMIDCDSMSMMNWTSRDCHSAWDLSLDTCLFSRHGRFRNQKVVIEIVDEDICICIVYYHSQSYSLPNETLLGHLNSLSSSLIKSIKCKDLQTRLLDHPIVYQHKYGPTWSDEEEKRESGPTSLPRPLWYPAIERLMGCSSQVPANFDQSSLQSLRSFLHILPSQSSTQTYFQTRFRFICFLTPQPPSSRH